MIDRSLPGALPLPPELEVHHELDLLRPQRGGSGEGHHHRHASLILTARQNIKSENYCIFCGLEYDNFFAMGLESLEIIWVEEGLLHLLSAAVISSFNIYRVRARVIIGKPQSRSAKRCTQTGARVRPERRTRPTGTRTGAGSPARGYAVFINPWVRKLKDLA